MQNTGWVKLHREVMKKALWQNINDWRLAETILMQANYEKGEFLSRKGAKIIVEIGQMITGLNQLSLLSGLSLQNVRTSLEHLKKLEFLTLTSTHHGTIISVCNYSTYQGYEDTNNTNQHANQHRGNTEVTTIKEVKEVKEVKEIKELTPPTSSNNILDKEEISLLEDLSLAEVKKVMKEKQEKPKPKQYTPVECVRDTDKIKLMQYKIETPEDLIEYWYDILNTFELNLYQSNDEKTANADFACANDMLINKAVSIEKLKEVLFDYAVSKFLHANYKKEYKAKHFSPVLARLSAVYKHMVALKYVNKVERIKKGGDLTFEERLAQYKREIGKS